MVRHVSDRNVYERFFRWQHTGDLDKRAQQDQRITYFVFVLPIFLRICVIDKYARSRIKVSQEHILRVHISSNSSGSITFERCSDNFDKSAWVWFHQKDGCHLSSENIPNLCDLWHLHKCGCFCPSCVALVFKDEIAKLWPVSWIVFPQKDYNFPPL